MSPTMLSMYLDVRGVDLESLARVIEHLLILLDVQVGGSSCGVVISRTELLLE